MTEGRLPTFIGIGAARCGSTAIHHYLDQHPEVYGSPIKETNFFAYEGQREHRYRVRSWRAYRDQFAGATEEKAVGEFSPLYMNNLLSAARIRAALPDVRLVVSLRSPTERAFSHWCHMVAIGIERRTAEEALRPGERWVEPSFYRERLEPYLQRFSREQLLIVLYEDLRQDPLRTMGRIYGHVGVDPGFVPDLDTRANAGIYPRYPRVNEVWQRLRRLQPRSFTAPGPLIRLNGRLLARAQTEPPVLEAALRQRLDVLYRAEVERMEALLDRDLDIWRVGMPRSENDVPTFRTGGPS